MATIDEPTYTFEIDMTYGGTWETVPNIVEWGYQRGRQEELGTIEPGHLTVIVANDGRWSKLNPTGPYHTSPRWVMRPCRLSATYGAGNYRLWRGYVQAWVPANNTPVDGHMIIKAVDYLYALHLSKPTLTLPQQLAGARIGAILDAVSAQPGEALARALDAGREEVLAATLTGQTTALAHIQEVLAGERGTFFQAADGTLTYHDRHHRFIYPSGYSSNATFGQADAITGAYPAGVLPYTGGMPALDDQRIYNTIVVTASGAGETGTATDGTSAGFHWSRTLPIAAPHMIAGQAQTLADWLLYVYKGEYHRLPALTIRPTTAAEWAQALARELGDRLIIRILEPGGLNYVRNVWIEGVTATWNKDDGQVTTWQLSDAESLGPQPFRLGISALNGGDVLIY